MFLSSLAERLGGLFGLLIPFEGLRVSGKQDAGGGAAAPSTLSPKGRTGRSDTWCSSPSSYVSGKKGFGKVHNGGF